MPISEKDIKLLWGRAAGKCAFPDCRMKLTQDKKQATESFPLGEQAHIVGESEDSPRGKSLLSEGERNSYANLILLCPNHHTIIDKNPEDYPVEKLYMIKVHHELWVEQTLSEGKDSRKTAQDIVYADLVDSAAKYCRFDDWEKWAFGLMAPNKYCELEFESDIKKFRKKIVAAVWPGSLPELERALKTLAFTIDNMMDKFTEHVHLKEEHKLHENWPYDNVWIEDKRYYNELVEEHEKWEADVDSLVVETTKAANWLADVTRRDINPMFYATKGKFIITYGPLEDLRTKTILPEYTEEERKGMPYREKFASGKRPPKKRN